ncbi:hypothetical protein [Aestuariimicrobium ganziense]|uniref:hypothetical protein n=1 Tax=Aestuariimicrobium ganziense TaxID=2773677 RepID=UPI001943A6D2|nr:hypothetical protein [Aestuariimicrobium ganziense]
MTEKPTTDERKHSVVPAEGPADETPSGDLDPRESSQAPAEGKRRVAMGDGTYEQDGPPGDA